MTDPDPFTDELDAPMYVVTAASGGERAGCLVGFASQCSIDPPRFAVWLSVANHTYRVAREAEYLTAHVLHRDERAPAELFGEETGDRVDKFATIGWRPGEGARAHRPCCSDTGSYGISIRGTRPEATDRAGAGTA
ncbi:flavin reductase family protein [Streptomyces sp. NPDC050842]|uniref:flavin reductase family protein n=1 Tax=Streptomyces sp. NPDC050842 TaxID=3365636 RepID=UPI0037AF0F99